ncbi:MAG: hypothetical protein JSS60_01595 [Verrucomicrobia bacterium]|nr:hypothetical protein [Verrucomicrobiota bacterium]
MAIDSVDSIGDVADDFDDIDWKEILDLPLWNGREVEQLSRLVQLNFVVSQIHSQFSQKGFHDNKHVQVGCRRFEIINLSEDPFFEFAKHAQSPFALHRPSDYEFSLADPTQLNPEISDCKNMFSRAWKGVKKGAKKVAHFVRDHKKEILIAAAAAAVIAGGIVVAGALSGAAAADAAANRRKEEEDTHSPEGTDAEPPAPPPEPDPIAAHPLPELTAPSITEQLPVDPTIQSPISSHMQTLQAARSGVEPPEIHPPTMPTADPNTDNLTASAGDHISNPQSAAGVPSDSSIATFFQHAWGVVKIGLDVVGRSVTAPEMQDSTSPLVLFSQEEIDKLKGNEVIPLDLSSQQEKLKADVALSIKNGFTAFLESLSSAPELINSYRLNGEAPAPSRSMCFHTEGTRETGTKITFINGIGNSFEDSYGSAQYISSLGSNVQIDGIYNKSNWAPIDVAEALLFNYQGYSPVTQDLLMKEWSDFHIENIGNPDAKILHFCHSQGAIHTYNALMRLPKEIRDRIIVVAIAPAIVIPEECCFDSYNYISSKDLVHYGQDFVTHISANMNEALRSELLSCLAKNKDQLIVLAPHNESDLLDHGLKNDTYKKRIQDHIEDYSEHDGEYK